MKRAFLFDMDGVMVNSEQIWENYGKEFEENVFGKDILEKIGDDKGMSLQGLHALAQKYGFDRSFEDVAKQYDAFMDSIYEKTTVTPGLHELLLDLKAMNFGIGVVSSSRKLWISLAFKKIPYKYLFDLILSIDEKNLPSKPNPAGYREAMKELGSVPSTTFILEDSNAGIESAKASGAFTIAFTGLLVKGYKQISADATAKSMKEVLKIVKANIALD